MFTTVATLYIAIGFILVFVGPAAGDLRDQAKSVQSQAVPRWKVVTFFVILAVSITLFWPVLVPSAAKSRRVNLASKHSDGTLLGLMEEMIKHGTDLDEIPGGSGEFGLEHTNPVPCRTIFGSRAYLNRLRTSEGLCITYTRVGSFQSSPSPPPVDGYDIHDTQGVSIATIYISPYHQRNSAKAPKGFILATNTHAVAPTTTEMPSARIAITPEPPPLEPSDTGRSEDPPHQDSSPTSFVNLDPAELLERARSGDADAQYRIGVMYEVGSLFPRDLFAAQRWYERAALKGHEVAGLFLSLLQPAVATAADRDTPTPDADGKELSERPWTIDSTGRVRGGSGTGLSPEQYQPQANKPESTAPTSLLRLDPEQRDTMYSLGLAVGRRCVQHCQRVNRTHPQVRFATEMDRFTFLSESRTRASQMARRRGYLDEDVDTGMADAVDGSDPLFHEKRLAFIHGVQDGIDGPDGDVL